MHLVNACDTIGILFYMKKIIFILLGIIAGACVLVALSGTVQIDTGVEKKTTSEEDTTEQATMKEPEARVIAEAACIKGGEALGPGTYNPNSHTWWFDANLNATKPGCFPACVVSEDTKTTEINWRCREFLPAPSGETTAKDDTVQNTKKDSDAEPLILTHKTWTFVEVKKGDVVLFTPKQKGAFTLIFEEGRVRMGTDCNSMGAAYIVKEERITFSESMSTMMYCEGSEEQTFSTYIGDVVAYRLERETLALILKENGGEMYFR